MRQILLGLCLLCLLNNASGQENGREIPLPEKMPQEHPRVLTTPDGKQDTWELIKKEKWAKDVFNKLKERTEVYTSVRSFNLLNTSFAHFSFLISSHVSCFPSGVVNTLGCSCGIFSGNGISRPFSCPDALFNKQRRHSPSKICLILYISFLGLLPIKYEDRELFT